MNFRTFDDSRIDERMWKTSRIYSNNFRFFRLSFDFKSLNHLAKQLLEFLRHLLVFLLFDQRVSVYDAVKLDDIRQMKLGLIEIFIQIRFVNQFSILSGFLLRVIHMLWLGGPFSDILINDEVVEAIKNILSSVAW